MQNGNAVSEVAGKRPYHLRGERYLGYEQYRAFAGFQDFVDKVDIYGGLSAAGNAAKQRCLGGVFVQKLVKSLVNGALCGIEHRQSLNLVGPYLRTPENLFKIRFYKSGIDERFKRRP